MIVTKIDLFPHIFPKPYFETIRVIDNITASIDDKKNIYEDNTRKFLGLN